MFQSVAGLYEKGGPRSKKVPITGLGDKRQITAVFAGAMSEVFLPPQLIYKSKTKACHAYQKYSSFSQKLGHYIYTQSLGQ